MTSGKVDLVGELVVAQSSKRWVPQATASEFSILDVTHQYRFSPTAFTYISSWRSNCEGAGGPFEFDELIA